MAEPCFQHEVRGGRNRNVGEVRCTARITSIPAPV